VSFSAAFGHMTNNIIRPTMRKLTCKDPRIVENFTRRNEKLATQAKLLEKVTALDRQARYPFNASLAFHYETLDAIHCQISNAAENKCRKLKKGQVAFSPTLQVAMKQIKAFHLLIKKRKGQKTSSRLIQRCLRQAGLTSSLYALSLEELEESQKQAYQDYYKIKAHHLELRKTYLEGLAEAMAEQHSHKEKNIRKLLHTEGQRRIARKIRFLRGKLSRNSTTMVTTETPTGKLQEITDKREMEHTIMKNNEQKFRQSYNTPFYCQPLLSEFGVKGITQASAAVLAGVYESN